MSERRYSDEEVAEIFARATDQQGGGAGRGDGDGGDGLTLAELREIGREAGIDAASIERAALSLDRAPPPPAPRAPLGLPLRVAHAVELPYRMGDAQWEALVAELRETFDATGRVRTEGSLRMWSNGNLQVLVEPSASGQRVRFRSMKGDSRLMMTGGAALLAVALVILLVSGGGDLSDALATALLGAGALVVGAGRLPRWAALRQSQFERIGERLLQAGPPAARGPAELS